MVTVLRQTTNMSITYTGGVYSSTPISLSSSPSNAPITAPGCSFYNTSDYNYTLLMRYDVAYLPFTDGYGTSTIGYKTAATDYYDSLNPYVNEGFRVDTAQSIIDASTSSADNIARTIRNDSTYTPIIYTIGLGGAPDMPVDQTFLERLANDPRAGSAYDSTKAAGLFVYASDAGSLSEAFNQIASQILRLSQ